MLWPPKGIIFQLQMQWLLPNAECKFELDTPIEQSYMFQKLWYFEV